MAITKLIEDFNLHKGELVITDSHKIERLIAIAEDDEDYYYVTYDGRKPHWNTCVGYYIPLKGRLKEEEYNKLLRIVKLNDYLSPTFLNSTPENNKPINDEAKNEVINSTGKNDRFLTEICLDFN